MTDATALLRALALAVREQLLGGGAATLPGLGTLARTHVPARVHTHPDGSKALLPPSETVGLVARPGDPAPLAALVVRHLGMPQADPAATLRAALDQLEARLAATGTARLDGIGSFERTSGGVRFDAVGAFLGDVNRPFSSMPAVGTPPAPDATLAPPPTLPPPPRADAPAPPEGSPIADAAPEFVSGVPVWTVGDPEPAATAETPDLDDTAPDDAATDDTAPDDWAPLTGSPSENAESETPGWATPMAPASDSLGVPDDIEDADFSIVSDPDSEAAEAPGIAPTPLDAGPVGEPLSTDPEPPFALDASPTSDLDADDDPGLPAEEALPAPPPPPEDATGGAEPDADPPGGLVLEPVALDEVLVEDLPPPTPAGPPGEETVSLAEVFAGDAPAATLAESFQVAPEAPALPIERVQPDRPAPTLADEMASLLGGAPIPAGGAPPVEPVDTPHPAAPPVPPEGPLAAADETPAARARWRWQQAFGWFLILTALAVALALVLADRDAGETDAPAVETVAPPTVDDAAPLVPLDDDTDTLALVAPGVVAPGVAAAGVAAAGGVAPGGAASEGADPTPRATPTSPRAARSVRSRPAPRTEDGGRRLGVAPQRGQAILPPRVAGLPAADVDALTGGEGVDARRSGVTWVVLSTASEPEADALAARYRTSGYRVSVLSTGGGGRAHRVVVGQFSSREQALRLRDRLPPQAPPDTWPLSL